MLARSQRVTSRMFDDVLKKGRVFHSPIFLARVMQDAKVKASRVAAVAPVKIAKTSVLRHRIRRKIYEAARPLMSKVSPGYVIVLFAKQPIIDATAAALQVSVPEIFVKAGLLR